MAPVAGSSTTWLWGADRGLPVQKVLRARLYVRQPSSSGRSGKGPVRSLPAPNQACCCCCAASRWEGRLPSPCAVLPAKAL